MFQTEAGKALAAEERTEAARSLVRTVRLLLGASTPRKRRSTSCWKAFVVRPP